MKEIIQLTNISKSYPKTRTGADRLSALKSALLNRPYSECHEIIQPLCLSVKQGESLGLIGENGAGKSTLLKLIAGVLTPTTGTVIKNGNIAALLELGAGFHPEHTGLDNIMMNAALSGFSKAELSKKLDDIVNFADIGDYIYEPTKHYSSGMVVRLGFAMMTAMRPDLLITDEVLAVGDESFQKKCITWMENYLSSGGTLLLCAHGMYHIQKLCKKVVWLDKGMIREYGDSYSVTQSYLAYHEKKTQSMPVNQVKGNSSQYYIKESAIFDENFNKTDLITYRKTFRVIGRVHSPDGREPIIAISIGKIGGASIFGTASWVSSGKLKKIDEHTYEYQLIYPETPLLPGSFVVKAHAMDPEGIRLFDEFCVDLRIVGHTNEQGSVALAHHWKA